MKITAKPIVKDKIWILRNNGDRVGLATKEEDGLHISTGSKITIVNDVKQAEAEYNIAFEKESTMSRQTAPVNSVYGYAATSKPHNPVYDVQRQVPLYTKSAKSKSWFAAGYYIVTFPNGTVISHCPKSITLQRYKYSGPFHSKTEAQENIHEHTTKRYITSK